jgi:hypothetical protein
VAASVSDTKKINFSAVFAGQTGGIKEVHDDIWLVSFMDYVASARAAPSLTGVAPIERNAGALDRGAQARHWSLTGLWRYYF